MDIVEFVEKTLGLQLFEYQKEILRQTQNAKHIYVIMPKHNGYDNYQYLACLARVVLNDPENLKGEKA